jgi:hypothetical protein
MKKPVKTKPNVGTRKPKKKVNETVYDVGNSKYFKSTQRTVRKSSSTEHWIFLDVNDENKVDRFTLKGTRVLVAKYPDYYKLYLYKTHTPDEMSWPIGGVTIYNATDDVMQSFYYESVVIHPDGGSYKFQT